MKRALLGLIFLQFVLPIYGQTKGLQVSESAVSASGGTIYALIVGISNYKNPAIPSLQYADKDALSFRNYLLASGVDSSHVDLLLNEKASNADFWSRIGYLLDVTKAGDKVYIYFSGHGDVENHTAAKDAFLLPYDAPKNMYFSGAIGVAYLKNCLSTLSSHGVKTIFIVDACKSGNLAGGREGMEEAAALLKDKWQDEVKILSCQPGELSLEGKQWGNGRGLFSYVLIKGLAGEADRNHDGVVSVRELNLYLTEQVPDQASPMPQNPIISGSPEYTLSYSNPIFYNDLKSSKGSQLLSYIDVRGFDDELLKGVNPAVKESYNQFKKYLDSSIYIAPLPRPSAYYYAIQIPDNDSTHLLKALVNQNLSAGMLKDVQLVADAFVNNRIELFNKQVIQRASVQATLLRAYLKDDKLKMLGLLPNIMAAEAIRFIFPIRIKDTTWAMSYNTAMAKLDTCVTMEPNSAFAYFVRAWTNSKVEKYNEALADLNKVLALSPNFMFAYNSRADFYYEIKLYDSAIVNYKKSLEDKRLYTDQVLRPLAESYRKLGVKDSADVYYHKCLDWIDKELGANPAENLWAKAYLNQSMGYFDEAIEQFKQVINLSVESRGTSYYNLCCMFAQKKDKVNAIHCFELALGNGFRDFPTIMHDADIDFIRTDPKFKKLLEDFKNK